MTYAKIEEKAAEINKQDIERNKEVKFEESSEWRTVNGSYWYVSLLNPVDYPQFRYMIYALTPDSNYIMKLTLTFSADDDDTYAQDYYDIDAFLQILMSSLKMNVK